MSATFVVSGFVIFLLTSMADISSKFTSGERRPLKIQNVTTKVTSVETPYAGTSFLKTDYDIVNPAMDFKVLVKNFEDNKKDHKQGALKEKCNNEQDLLQRCSMALPVLSSPEISFALTREELDKSCVELRAGIKCIDNYTDVCMEKTERMVFRRIYAGITGVVQELCTRGSYQDEYLRHADCVKNVRPEYEKCSKKYEVTLTELSNHQRNSQYDTDDASNHEDYLRTVCCSFQEYLLCSEQTVQRSCGDEAALFTSAFLKRMASNIIKNFCLEYRGQECGLPGASTRLQNTSALLSLPIFAQLIAYMNGHLVPA